MKAKTMYEAVLSAREMETEVEVVEEAGSRVFHLYQVEVTDVTSEICNPNGTADKKFNKRVVLRIKAGKE